MKKREYTKAKAKYDAGQAKKLRVKLEAQKSKWEATKKFKQKEALKALKEDDQEIRDLLNHMEEEGFEDEERKIVLKATSEMLKKANDWVQKPTGTEGPVVFALAVAIGIKGIVSLIERLKKIK